MINEVTITVKFVTGTSEQDSKRAEERCKELLLNKLKNTAIDGLFSIEIIKVESETI